MSRLRFLALPCSLALLAPACALTSKSAPVEIRYYTPEGIDAPRITAAPRPASARPPLLRIGRITAGSHLRTKIVVRKAANELATYDDDRWTESPEIYLRRSLERTLFEEERVARGYAGPIPVLDVELVAFEEVRRGDAVSGRVEIAFVLHDERDVLASGRFAFERPAASAAMRDAASAIGAALEASTTRLAEIVEKRVAPDGAAR
jgi:ABC-type uncharacterized transport system auxiliary subunit